MFILSPRNLFGMGTISPVHDSENDRRTSHEKELYPMPGNINNKAHQRTFLAAASASAAAFLTFEAASPLSLAKDFLAASSRARVALLSASIFLAMFL